MLILPHDPQWDVLGENGTVWWRRNVDGDSLACRGAVGGLLAAAVHRDTPGGDERGGCGTREVEARGDEQVESGSARLVNDELVQPGCGAARGAACHPGSRVRLARQSWRRPSRSFGPAHDPRPKATMRA